MSIHSLIDLTSSSFLDGGVWGSREVVSVGEDISEGVDEPEDDNGGVGAKPVMAKARFALRLRSTSSRLKVGR